MIRFSQPPLRTFTTGSQKLDKFLDSIVAYISKFANETREAARSDGPPGAIPWYNPGPASVEKGFFYGLDAATNTYVLADGITASVIQPLFVAATAIAPNTFGWAWIIGPAEVAPDGGSFPLGAAVWISATAGWEGTITTTRPVGQTQFMMGWVTNDLPTADSLMRVFLLPQPKRT